MSPIIEKRFQEGAAAWNLDTVIGGKVVSSVIQTPREAAPAPPIPPVELETMLRGETPEEKPLMDESKIAFSGLSSFVGWYLPLKDKFSKEQQEAFGSLCALEVLVNSGCSCNKSGRNSQAQEYYKGFFLTNHERGNDLIKTIKNIAKVSTVAFSEESSPQEPFLVA